MIKNSRKLLKRDREPAVEFYHDTIQNSLIRNTDLGLCSLKRESITGMKFREGHLGR